MLVPLDGSELAEVVFPYAKHLAARFDLHPVFLHVCDPWDAGAQATHQAYLDGASDTVTCKAAKLLKGLGSDPPPHSELEAQCVLVTGNPAEEIVYYAESENIDLILMATHGRSGIKRWALGSVADKVLRASKVPVWLARAGLPEEILHGKLAARRILVPLDGSKAAETILPYIEMLTERRGPEPLEVTLIEICRPPFITADYPEANQRLTWTEHVALVQDRFKQGCEEYLAGVEKRLREAGVTTKSEVLMGIPADEIISYAKRNHIYLIAMCTQCIDPSSPSGKE